MEKQTTTLDMIVTANGNETTTIISVPLMVSILSVHYCIVFVKVYVLST